MRAQSRIGTVYVKELTDILRDRRTLIAMVVVPIVLYPLLMLGSIQAVTYQAERLEDEEIIVGVVGTAQSKLLQWLVEWDDDALKRERMRLGPDSGEAARLPTSLVDRIKIHDFANRDLLEEMIRARHLHAGIAFKDDAFVRAADGQNLVEILADREVVRSQAAEGYIRNMIDRITERLVKDRKRQSQLPVNFDRPFNVQVTDLSSPSSILGQILPLILVLMTITGAIYPAIDLTAGERERGTLESLMSSPVPVFDLIVGKFLVVTTVALMGATLNLVSVSATVYVGGFDKVIADTGGAIPVGGMVLILLCLIPFAILMSGIMIAVCSCARTFKEAQNYVTPVIVAVLIPGGIAALPATRLEGLMLVMPVGNMVLLARDLLLGADVSWWHVLMVVLSTTLYAGAAVAVATSMFGRESVVFADAASWKTVLSRRLFKQSAQPTVSMGLIIVALLFPTWFFVQSILSPGREESAAGLLFNTAWLMPVLFVLLPAAALRYWKVDLRNALALRTVSGRYMAAAVLIGISAWIPIHEFSVAQLGLFGTPRALEQSSEMIAETLAALPVISVLLVIAVIPALCEELLFRGLLLQSLRTSTHKWPAILISSAVFAVFHFWLFRFVITALLGLVLAYICWQSRSIIPSLTIHLLHNGIGALTIVYPGWHRWLGLEQSTENTPFPIHVVITGVGLSVIGLFMAMRSKPASAPHLTPAAENGAPAAEAG